MAPAIFKSLRRAVACVGVVAFFTIVSTAELVTIDASTIIGDLLLDGASYPDGLTIQNIAAKTVTLQHVTVGCPGLRITGGQDAGGRLTLNNVTAACSAVPAGEGVILMSGGSMRGAVTVENCTVSGDRAQTDSTLLQIRKPAGRLAIRGGRFTLSSDFPTHRCIDLRNVQSTAVVTVDDVYTRANIYGSNGGSGLRIDRAVAGTQVTVNGGFFEGRVNRIDGYGVELVSVPAGVTVTLNNIAHAIGDGRSDCAALKVLNSACNVSVNGGKFTGEASTLIAKAMDFDAFSGVLTVTNATLVSEGDHTGATTVWIRTCTGRFTFSDSVILATARTSGARGFGVLRLSGAAAVLSIDNCTVTAKSTTQSNAIELEQTSGGAMVSITRTVVNVGPRTTGFVFQDHSVLTALRVTSLTGGATVNVSDSTLTSRADDSAFAVVVADAAVGTAVTLLRSTISATAVKGIGARAIGYSSSATSLTVDGCTITASSVKSEVVGVFLYRSVGGSVTFTGSTFNIITAEDSPVVRGTILYNGGIVALDDSGTTAASALTMSVAHCSFNGDRSAARLVLVRYPRQWSGVSKLTIVDVAATAHFNSFRGFIAVASTYRQPSVAVGASITRCFTDISRGGIPIAHNIALPNTASTVDCAGAPTPVPATPVPETPAPRASSSSSELGSESASGSKSASAPSASVSSGPSTAASSGTSSSVATSMTPAPRGVAGGSSASTVSSSEPAIVPSASSGVVIGASASVASSTSMAASVGQPSPAPGASDRSVGAARTPAPTPAPTSAGSAAPVGVAVAVLALIGGLMV